MKLFLIVCLCYFIVGCVSTEVRSNVVEQHRVEVVKVAEDLLESCHIEPPPSISEYSAANRDAKEDMLVRYTITLLRYSDECSQDKRIIRDTQIAQLKAAEAFNQKEKERIEQLRKELGE